MGARRTLNTKFDETNETRMVSWVKVVQQVRLFWAASSYSAVFRTFSLKTRLPSRLARRYLPVDPVPYLSYIFAFVFLLYHDLFSAIFREFLFFWILFEFPLLGYCFTVVDVDIVLNETNGKLTIDMLKGAHTSCCLPHPVSWVRIPHITRTGPTNIPKKIFFAN